MSLTRYGLLLAGLLLAGVAQAGGQSAMRALQCQQPRQCAYFSDVYGADRAFRTALHDVLGRHGVARPSWLARGVVTPLWPLRQGGNDYLTGSVCEPHNCGHQLRVLYAPRTRQLYALYLQDDGGQQWLGQPDALQRSLLLGEGDPSSPLYGHFSDGEALPLLLP